MCGLVEQGRDSSPRPGGICARKSARSGKFARRWQHWRVSARLIEVDEACARVLDAARPLAGETVAIDEALGRVLAEDVESAADVPPFDSSAMDGFALVAAGGAGE